MHPIMKALCVFAACAAVSSVAMATDVVESRFDTGAEGWTVSEVWDDTFVPGGSWLPLWGANAGLEGGGLYIHDVGPGGTIFVAPDAFLGDRSAWLGGHIAWDMANNLADYEKGEKTWSLMLAGGGHRIRAMSAYPREADRWIHAAVPLDVAHWYHYTGEGVTASELADALADITELYFKADWGWGSETTSMDTVVLSPWAVPEPASAGLLVLGGLGGLARRRASGS